MKETRYKTRTSQRSPVPGERNDGVAHISTFINNKNKNNNNNNKKGQPSPKNNGKSKEMLKNMIKSIVQPNSRKLPHKQQIPKQLNPKVNSYLKGKTTLNSYVCALQYPFSPEAIGAKVPDAYTFPTNSFHHRTTYILGTAGTSFSGVFIPSPFCTFIDNGKASGSTGIGTNSYGGCYTMGGASSVVGLCTPSQMSSVCNSFRVVGGGIRIRNLQSEYAAVGRIYAAVVPIADAGIPSFDILDSYLPTSTGYGAIYGNMGLPAPGQVHSASLQSFPLSDDFTVSELVAGDEIDINFHISHPKFYSFKAAYEDSTVTSTNVQGDNVYVTSSTGIVQKTTNKSNMQADGASAILLYFEGFPGTASVAQIEVDVILHYECTPYTATSGTTSTSGFKPTMDCPPVAFKGSSMAVESIITKSSEPAGIIKGVKMGAAKLSAMDQEYLGGVGLESVKNIATAALKYMLI